MDRQARKEVSLQNKKRRKRDWVAAKRAAKQTRPGCSPEESDSPSSDDTSDSEQPGRGNVSVANNFDSIAGGDSSDNDQILAGRDDVSSSESSNDGIHAVHDCAAIIDMGDAVDVVNGASAMSDEEIPDGGMSDTVMSDDVSFDGASMNAARDHDDIVISDDEHDQGHILSVSEDSSDDEELETPGKRVKRQLIAWRHKHDRSTLMMVDDLLHIFRQAGFADDLPKCARTLLNTQREVHWTMVSGMKYYYFGVEKMLTMALDWAVGDIITDVLNLILSTDGLPIYNSCKNDFWPILCSVDNIKTRCSIVPFCITGGKMKPDNLDFFNETVQELNQLIDHGLNYNGKVFRVRVVCCVCDAPARAMVKLIKGHGGFYSCDKCTQKGETIANRRVFAQIEGLTLRTHESYCNREQIEHHIKLNEVSPMQQLQNFDMVCDFSLDYMHLICLGLMKKLLKKWTGIGRFPYVLSEAQKDLINALLLEWKRCIPWNFQRKSRDLKHLDKWKATEFRLFLLYIGPFILRDILDDTAYENFMCLSVGISILLSAELVPTHGAYAHSLLKHFIRTAAAIYGDHFVIFNVHGLVHLLADAQRYGSLEICSAWKFENYLRKLKAKVKGSYEPVVQIVKRLSEGPIMTEPDVPLIISCTPPNNAFVNADTGNFVEIVNEIRQGVYNCREYYNLQSAFPGDNPCDSRTVFCGKAVSNENQLVTITADKLKHKSFMFVKNGIHLFHRLLHSW